MSERQCIAPHEYNELELVEVGVKPLAIIYHSKTPKMYRAACRTHLPRKLVRGGVVAIATEQEHILNYEYLVNNLEKHAREQHQRCMGKLLGYDNNDVEEYIKSEVGMTCPCIECGGKPK